MANTLLVNEGFPKVPGDFMWSLVDVLGPSSYTQVSPASPPTGGQSVSLQTFGFSTGILWAAVTGSDDGTYSAICFLIPFAVGMQASTGITLEWITAATGAQVSGAANLSSRSVRVLAFGR